MLKLGACDFVCIFFNHAIIAGSVMPRGGTGCLQCEGVSKPSMSPIRKAVTKEELARHYRRRTRGAAVTESLIEALQLVYSLGVLVLSDQITRIWEEEKKHVPCIQDSEGIPFTPLQGT